MSACPKCHAVFMTFPHTCGLGTPHMAEFVPVEEKPEEYIRQVRREPTAYDRAQQEVERRLQALESCAVGTSGSLIDTRRRLEELWEVSNLTIVDVKKLRSESDDCLRQQLEFFKLSPRLDAALRRIEALELEVARLKGPQTAYTQAIDEKLKIALKSMQLVLQAADMGISVEQLATHLGCGCEGPFCKGHPFSGGVTRCTLPPSDANGSPLPDEGT